MKGSTEHSRRPVAPHEVVVSPRPLWAHLNPISFANQSSAPQTKRNVVLSFWAEFFLFLFDLEGFVKLLFKLKLGSTLFEFFLYFLLSLEWRFPKSQVVWRGGRAHHGKVDQRVTVRASVVGKLSMSSGAHFFFPPKVQAPSPFFWNVCLRFLCSKWV